MNPNLTPIPLSFPGGYGRLFRSPMPFTTYDSGQDLLSDYRRYGIDVVVMLVSEEEAEHRIGRSLRRLYTEAGLDVISFPVEDFRTPDPQGLEVALNDTLARLRDGQSLVVHCNAGLGRTGTFIACLGRRLYGFDGQAAVNWVRRYIPSALENELQLDFVRHYANSLRLIVNGKLITWEQPNQILEGHALLVVDGQIAEIGPQYELETRYPQAVRLDAAGQFVMPANICAHTHFYGAYARGMAIPGPAPANFPQILQKLWWPLDLALDEDAVRASALVCLIEAVQHGTTVLIDHHASPNCISGSLDIVAEAVEQSGLRAALCYEVTDRNGPDGARAGIAENVRFIERTRNSAVAGGRVRATFGLHAGLTLSEETLTACRQTAPADCGFHIHVAESEADEYDSLGKTGERVVDRLARHGLLGPQSIAVHCVHVDAREIQLLADSGTWVTHQPRSNMNNAVGIGAVESMLRSGVRVCLGNDGFSNAMWEEWKTAYLVHKAWHHDPRRMNGNDVIQMAVYNNAALAHRFWPEAPLGVLAPGAAADLIFVDYQPYTPLTAGNLPWQVLFGFHESQITLTMASGQVLMQHGQLLTLDAEKISSWARSLAPKVWERYSGFAARFAGS